MDTPARVYSADDIQKERIEKARSLVSTLSSIRTDLQCPVIVELGCGTADITGPLSETCEVHGFDVNLRALDVAARRYPNMYIGRTPIENIEPFPCDVLVLCETLEHLTDPVQVVKDWLPLAATSVISHPLDEALDSDISGGEHTWSFDLHDFRQWFHYGGHFLTHMEQFQMGKYNMILGGGER